MHLSSETWFCIFGSLVALLVRCCTMLHPYSGQGKPPMYGDYEAQRHWMEITVNLPPKDWYYNTSDNDLQYWGLDYPPLTAYHSYACGVVAEYINQSYVKLHLSRGLESEDHKLFMRYTVLFVDLLIYFPAVFTYFILTKNVYKPEEIYTEHKGAKHKTLTKNTSLKISTSLAIVLSLLYPGIILIDHGHFQYNCVSLAFAIFAVAFICTNRYVSASFFFCLALNYKQMELYHALPFFMYLLSLCIPKPGQSSLSGFVRLTKISLTVILAFAIIWLPFISSLRNVIQVLHRLFPVARGLFEDKVANVWCALNIIYKFKTRFCNQEMLRYCTIVTLASVLPSLIDLFLRPNVKKFVPSLINSALAFFLFSFQVHEKSILLAAIPVMLYLPNDPLPCFWFLFISTFSMLPLLIKDELVIAFFALTAFYIIIFILSIQHAFKMGNKENILHALYMDISNILVDVHKGRKNFSHVYNVISKHFLQNYDCVRKFVLFLTMVLSFLGSVGLTIAILCCDPPQEYPDLFPLLISIYCCVHFLGFFVYFNVVQMLVPQSFGIPHLKIKTS